jgi:hypothetical protein
MIDVQVRNRRVRLSSGTRDKSLALRRQQHVAEALRDNPQITDELLRIFARGNVRALDAHRCAGERYDVETRQATDTDDDRFWACLS